MNTVVTSNHEVFTLLVEMRRVALSLNKGSVVAVAVAVSVVVLVVVLLTICIAIPAVFVILNVAALISMVAVAARVLLVIGRWSNRDRKTNFISCV